MSVRHWAAHRYTTPSIAPSPESRAERVHAVILNQSDSPAFQMSTAEAVTTTAHEDVTCTSKKHVRSAPSQGLA
jgi:hypothetical protein